jgi:hypothetical protein
VLDGGEEAERALSLLAQKYEQYRETAPAFPSSPSTSTNGGAGRRQRDWSGSTRMCSASWPIET